MNDVGLYIAQVLKHSFAIMNLGKSKCITGLHFVDSIESQKLEIGCSWSLLANNFPDLYKYITHSWVTHTWTFMWGELFPRGNAMNIQIQRSNNSHIIKYSLVLVIIGEYLAELNIC